MGDPLPRFLKARTFLLSYLEQHAESVTRGAPDADVSSLTTTGQHPFYNMPDNGLSDQSHIFASNLEIERNWLLGVPPT